MDTPYLIVITSNTDYPNEDFYINRILSLPEVSFLHIRKYGSSPQYLHSLIQKIAPQYRKKIIMHHNHEIVPQYHLGGFYLNRQIRQSKTLTFLWKVKKIIYRGRYVICAGAHSYSHISQFSFASYILFSPVFKPISKKDILDPLAEYNNINGNFFEGQNTIGGDCGEGRLGEEPPPGHPYKSPPLTHISTKLINALSPTQARVPVIALGGIVPEVVPYVLSMGFRGVASSGYIWESPDPYSATLRLINAIKSWKENKSTIISNYGDIT